MALPSDGGVDTGGTIGVDVDDVAHLRVFLVPVKRPQKMVPLPQGWFRCPFSSLILQFLFLPFRHSHFHLLILTADRVRHVRQVQLRTTVGAGHGEFSKQIGYLAMPEYSAVVV